MAVTLTIADLKQPTGELTATLFPGDELDTLLTGWLVQASTVVVANAAIATSNHNLAAAAWIYYRAYDYVSQRLAIAPVRVAVSLDGSQSKEMAVDQRKFWADRAIEKKAEYEGLETLTASTTAAIPVFFGIARANT